MNSQMNNSDDHASVELCYSQLLHAPSMEDIADYLKDVSSEIETEMNNENNAEIVEEFDKVCPSFIKSHYTSSIVIKPLT